MSSDSVLRPRVLVLASRYDLTCDYVVSALHSLHTACLRLNTEDLPHFELALDPVAPLLRGVSPEVTFEICNEHLAGVYFRQPTFLRDASLLGRPAEGQFCRAQWAAFVRSTMIFDRCVWINHPARTYSAEHKALQLKVAAQVGFDVPRTSIANSGTPVERVAGTSDCVAVKGLDTVLVREGNTESFGYTNLLSPEEIHSSELRSAPLILQEGLKSKLDLRVTVVGDVTWCASVTVHGEPIVGDWRLAKADAEFARTDLPTTIAARCVSLVRRLGLQFGAIDLALSQGRYYFLEVNPTGEWAWLQAALNLPIGERLAKVLASGPTEGCCLGP
ncbi:MAG: RimK-like protein [Bryobacteraceae bacterium]|jgi:hypothetical protein